jgi:hypothetical protein
MRVDDSRSNVSRYVNLQISGIPFRANLKLVRELKDRRAQGRACGNLGNTYYLLGNFNKAIQYHREVSIFRFYYAVHRPMHFVYSRDIKVGCWWKWWGGVAV